MSSLKFALQLAGISNNIFFIKDESVSARD